MSSGFTLTLSKATINGTSTLHDWESQVTEITAKGSFQVKDKSIATIQDAVIKIAVTGIKSKEGKKMDNKTYEAFKSDENPSITYAFKNAAVKISADHLVTIEAAGTLSMAGTSKPVSLSAKGKELPNGDLQLSVSKTLKMTDFNMEPPVMLLGTIKVGDEITVTFDFELSKLPQ
jgi:polyisoprenoid-binding protein YceI